MTWIGRVVAFIKGVLRFIFDAFIESSSDSPGSAQLFERVFLKDYMSASLSFAGPGVKPAYVRAQLNIAPGCFQSARSFGEILDDFLNYVPPADRPILPPVTP